MGENNRYAGMTFADLLKCHRTVAMNLGNAVARERDWRNIPEKQQVYQNVIKVMEHAEKNLDLIEAEMIKAYTEKNNG